LSSNQISNNFAAGLLAEVPVTVYAPSISPANVITAGNSATLSAVSSNALYTFAYQWYWDSGSLGATWTAITGATNATYEIDTTGLAAGNYEYEVLLTNGVYSLGEFSSPITVTVNPLSAPSIVQDITPSSLTTYVTVTNMLAVDFSGASPITFQWQVSTDDSHWTETGIFTTNIIVESEVPLTEYYRLTASNALGTSVSSAAEVIVQAALPLPAYLPLQSAGDLIVNLQQADLSGSSTYWSNVTGSPAGVGNFSGVVNGGSNLVVGTGAPYLYNRVKTLYVDSTASNALQSLFAAPAEIIGNNPVSAEAWVYATSVTDGNNTAIAYGNQEQNNPPQTDREFNYGTGGAGATSGDFGSYDAPWASGTVTAGTWHYLAWTYDGTMMNAYMDGQFNTSHVPSAPNVTPETLVCVGGAIGQVVDGIGDTNLAVDIFAGYIGAARLESGLLSAAQIQNNYNAGLMGVLPAVVWPPSVTPPALNNLIYQGSTVTLGLVDRETTSFTYQWMTDNGTLGATWSPINGATGTNYALNVSSLNAGTTYEYEIVLNSSTYSLSITTAPVDLTVEAAGPTVKQQPAPSSTNVYVGQSVTFTAAFTGNQPITNQWQFSSNGTAYSSIPGANNATLTLTDVQLTNTGSYRLTASNSQGAGSPSAAATLTVTEPPNVSFSLSASSLTLTWTGNGTLVEASSLTGPWTVVTTTSPYALTPATAGPALFFKVNYGP